MRTVPPRTSGIPLIHDRPATLVLALAAFALAPAAAPAAGQTSDREYTLVVAADHDLVMPATAGITAFRAAQDAFTYGIGPRLPEGVAGIAGGVWAFATTYLALIWSHEFGHVLRADQVGGEFRIHDIGLPIPYTTMHLPDGLPLDREALTVTAGFEVNALSARMLRQDFFRRDGLANGDLSLAFAHRMMFPLYTSLITPHDPADPVTWTETSGDPVHFILPVWENYSGGAAIAGDGSVEKGLVDFYNRAALYGLVWNLLDPTFYQQLLANFADVSDATRPWWAVDTGSFAWTWSTLFNASPLGYELYLNQHVRLRDRVFTVYGRTASPYHARGLGLLAPDIVRAAPLGIGLSLEVWDQALYGTGWSATGRAGYRVAPNFDVALELGWKDTGYVLGRPVESGALMALGVTYVRPGG